MNKLPLSPTDVTEFTCDAACILISELASMAQDPHRIWPEGYRARVHNAAIAAEWSHRIAVEAADAQRMIDSDNIDVYEAGRIKRDAVLVASRAYVAWLDSLKGGQNG